MALINLTPHKIVFFIGNHGHVVPPSGSVARLRTRTVDCAPIVVGDIWIPRVGTVYEGVEGLPEFNGEDTFIVSTMVAQVAKRGDVVSPDTGFGSVVRDHNGSVVGVTRFQCFD